VQSLRGNWISKYRMYEYTYGQQVHRRIQDMLGVISVFPGPVTCFRTDILSKLDFEVESLTEDFDLTLQVHRKKLGKILYIPQAQNFTQDPQTYKDFCKQTLRWQRGFFQGVLRHRIGTKPKLLDAYMAWQALQSFLFLMQLVVGLPVAAAMAGDWFIWPTAVLINFAIMSLFAVGVAAIGKRPSILLGLPGFYILSLTELVLFLRAYIDVVMLRRFRTKIVGWNTEGRRYEVNKAALKDTAGV
jgi:poly-beta-1,6-N-acetyl-D-glucosamine synthase